MIRVLIGLYDESVARVCERHKLFSCTYPKFLFRDTISNKNVVGKLSRYL